MMQTIFERTQQFRHRLTQQFRHRLEKLTQEFVLCISFFCSN